MNDVDRWKRVQAVFTAALDLEPGARAALLDRECAMDEELRREVASLLVAHDRTGAVDRLALEVLSPAVDRVRSIPAVQHGQVVSHYVVLDRLGAGGMGVVYRARDERLDRSIALKFLSPDLVANRSAKQRFLLEARTAAALEHPNVCTIYEIGETPDGHLFIAMPLYDGETLMTRVARGPLPMDQAVWVAREIGSGLAAAHQHGIVHRDVKPSNVMLLPDGRLKILDFGVAKVKDSNLTATGTPIGTIAYMSPEQTRGEQVDQRADIWAVGVVLYEMLTGRRPFTGDTAAALMHAITTRPHAPASHLRERLPEELDDVIAMCLAKTPERRFATMQDVVAALDPTRPASRTSRAADTRAADTITLDDGSAAPAAEKRRATVLVVTISDYASLLERLSPSDVDEAVGLVRTAAGDAVRRHGGLVNEAAEEEVVALFGIPATHEDDDVRAVKAALELHERIRAVARSASDRIGQSLVVQTGIDSGSLVVQRLREGPRRYSVSGAPAQIAARLASLAAPDTILIGPGCQRLVDPFVATEPARPIELGPNTPPIVPHRVVGESGVQTRLEASDRATLAPFTGRSAELSSLETAVREAATGAGRMVLVVGEAGMGKSRIIHELRERVRHTDARVLLGRCRSYGGVSPYLPIVEFLRDIIGAAHDEDGNQLAAKIRRIDSSLEPFLPLYLHLLSARSEAYPVPRHLQGEDLHAAMVDAVIAMVMTAARQSPLLLLLEDWHWADNASREVLQRLAEVVDSLPIAIIVATRPEPAVLAELGSLGTIVQLGALERSSTAILLTALLDADRISDALVAGVHDRTGGNPFFIEQVVHTLHEEGAIVTKGGETTLTRDIESLRLPDTVQAVIRARIDRLDGDSREVLRIASVIGREFGRTVLVAAVPRGIDTLRALERLRNAALVQQVHVVPEPVYRFKHVLTQEVAYGSLLAHQRQAAHGAIGHALEREAGHIDDLAETLAHHFGQAESWEAAVKYGTRAAERLSALSQYANALAMFERLHAWVSHLPDDAARRDAMADILLEQERLCETLGQRQRQQQIINELISLLAPHGASSRLAAAYVRQGDLLTLLKRFDAADRALSTVLRLSRDGADKQLERNALRSLGLLRWHQDRHREALSIAETTLEINRALGDELAAAGDLSNIGNILRGMGELDRARAVFEEALEMPALQRDPTLIPSIMHNLALVHRAGGDLDLALDYLQRADDFRREKLLPLGRAIHLTTIAHIHLQQGDADKALQIYRQAVELSRRSRHAEGLAQSLRLLGELQFGLQQHNVEAVANLSEAATLFAQLEDHAAEVQAWTQVAAGHERLGDWAPARESWTEVRRLRQTLGDRKGELDALEGFARASRPDQEPAVAITAFEDALAMANALGEQAREAALHNTLGILEWERGRYLDALGHYESGLRLCRTIGDRTHEGLMLNSMGVTLARLQRHEEARTVLEESVALTRETGERLLEAHALTALGDVSLHLGRPETARECHDAAAVLRRTIDRNSTDLEKG